MIINEDQEDYKEVEQKPWKLLFEHVKAQPISPLQESLLLLTAGYNSRQPFDPRKPKLWRGTVLASGLLELQRIRHGTQDFSHV